MRKPFVIVLVLLAALAIPFVPNPLVELDLESTGLTWENPFPGYWVMHDEINHPDGPIRWSFYQGLFVLLEDWKDPHVRVGSIGLGILPSFEDDLPVTLRFWDWQEQGWNVELTDDESTFIELERYFYGPTARRSERDHEGYLFQALGWSGCRGFVFTRPLDGSEGWRYRAGCPQ